MDLSRDLQRFMIAALTLSRGDFEKQMSAIEIASRAGLKRKSADWIADAVSSLGSNGLLNTFHQEGPAADSLVHVTQSGLVVTVQAMLKDGRLPSRHKDAPNSEDSETVEAPSPRQAQSGIQISHAENVAPSNSVSSAAWTGRKSSAILEGERLEVLKGILNKAEIQLREVGIEDNQARQQAFAILVAVKSLAEAPNPPEEIIKELLLIGSAVASIGSLLLAALAVLR